VGAASGRRLYLKLYLAFLGVLVAVALVSVGISFAMGKGAFEAWSRGPRIASHVARSLPPVTELAELQSATEQANDELGLDLAVLETDRGVVASAGAPIPLPGELALMRAHHFAIWVEPGIVAAPLRGSGGRAVLLVRFPLPPGAAAHIMPWRPVITLLGALLVSALLLFPLSRSITAPLERLTASVEAFGRGDLGARANIEAEDEVGRLARSFDEMAARIEAARRAEKELLANVSHELRTPLARMKVALELLQIRDDPAAQKRIRGLNEEIDELDRLVADVLTASRLDLASQPLRKVVLPVREVLEKARARVLALAPEQAVEVEAPEPLTVHADEALLSRALDNLIENARKYGGNGGAPILASAQREGAGVLFTVRDHGPGFAPDELARVFEPFFRGEGARGQAAGYGLGLALARRVAEAHGGSIRALNAEGGGAKMELRIPL
jgi:signal transduction histidine kinase